MGWKEGGKKKWERCHHHSSAAIGLDHQKKRGRAMSQLECRRSCPPVTTGGNCSLLFPPLSSFPHLIMVISEKIKKNLTTKGHHHPRPRSCPRYKFYCRGQHEQFQWLPFWNTVTQTPRKIQTFLLVVIVTSLVRLKVYIFGDYLGEAKEREDF